MDLRAILLHSRLQSSKLLSSLISLSSSSTPPGLAISESLLDSWYCRCKNCQRTV